MLKLLVLESSSLPKKKFWRFVGNKATVKSPKKPDCIIVNSGEGFIIDYTAYYPHKVIDHQHHSFHFDEANYIDEIARARPPGFLINDLCKRIFLGLDQFHGVNEVNYLLVTSKNSEYANSETYAVRYNGEEFVRHKILDVLGTLALTGRQFKDTAFTFTMTGHRFDLYALKYLFNQGYFKTA